MLCLGKLSRKNIHTAQAEGTGIMCSINLSATLILLAKFYKSTQWTSVISVTLTTKYCLWAGM